MPQLRALVSQTLLEDYPLVLTRVETRYADIVTTTKKMRIGYGVPDVAQLACRFCMRERERWGYTSSTSIVRFESANLPKSMVCVSDPLTPLNKLYLPR